MSVPMKLSESTEKLIGFLVTLTRSGVKQVSYEKLSTVAGIDVTSIKGRGYLTTARKRVQADHGDVWGTTRGKGLYLVPQGERARCHQNTTAKVRRAVGRTNKVMDTVDVSNLSPEDLESFNTGRVVLSLVGKAASRAVTNRIEQAAKDQDVRVVEFNSIDATLDFLKKARGPRKEKPETRPEKE